MADVASVEVPQRLCTLPGILHGGMVMAFADALGAVAATLNLAPGDATTTTGSSSRG